MHRSPTVSLTHHLPVWYHWTLWNVVQRQEDGMDMDEQSNTCIHKNLRDSEVMITCDWPVIVIWALPSNTIHHSHLSTRPRPAAFSSSYVHISRLPTRHEWTNEASTEVKWRRTQPRRLCSMSQLDAVSYHACGESLDRTKARQW